MDTVDEFVRRRFWGNSGANRAFDNDPLIQSIEGYLDTGFHRRLKSPFQNGAFAGGCSRMDLKSYDGSTPL